MMSAIFFRSLKTGVGDVPNSFGIIQLMGNSNDKKILWTMGIVASCLIVLIVSLALFSNVEDVNNWRVLMPISFAIGGIIISAILLLFVLKCGCK